MRRKDREITDFARICQILDQAAFLTLSLIDDGVPYSVPVNFGWRADGDHHVQIFIHGATTGKKIDCITACAAVSFCAVSFSHIGPGERACDWTNFYGSVCGSGTAAIVTDTDEKKEALLRILKKYGYDGSNDIPAPMLQTTAVIRIDAHHLTGKAHADAGNE
ncbi:MAG: pyridoxamine 5'-phosphate oxidase family protein [Treponemataceae bacterium]|nr:pyridoxamine 5'-phosphate oxidase family protein [Treponemataceae bacterium]